MIGRLRPGPEAVKQGSHGRRPNPGAPTGRPTGVSCTRRHAAGRGQRVAMPTPSLVLLAVAGALAARDTTGAAARARLLAELDRDVWRPFVAGIRADSAPLYERVHARDFHWVAPGAAGLVMDRAAYDADSREVMGRRRAEGATTDVEVRFLERNVTPTLAVEKVVTRWAIHRPGRAPEVGHGVAHYFSRPEQGVWRVFLRHGSTERATAETFARAAPVGER